MPRVSEGSQDTSKHWWGGTSHFCHIRIRCSSLPNLLAGLPFLSCPWRTFGHSVGRSLPIYRDKLPKNILHHCFNTCTSYSISRHNSRWWVGAKKLYKGYAGCLLPSIFKINQIYYLNCNSDVEHLKGQVTLRHFLKLLHSGGAPCLIYKYVQI